MASIPRNYPQECTPEVIRNTILALHSELVENKFDINSVLQFSPLINLGQSELERRQNEAIVKQSRVVSYISVGIALIAITISVVGSIGNSGWEAEQLTILKSIEGNTNTALTLTNHSDLLEEIRNQLGAEITCVLKSNEIQVIDPNEAS